jgi:hypothetical protein
MIKEPSVPYGDPAYGTGWIVGCVLGLLILIPFCIWAWRKLGKAQAGAKNRAREILKAGRYDDGKEIDQLIATLGLSGEAEDKHLQQKLLELKDKAG